MKIINLRVIFFIIISVFCTNIVFALPPPDFIIQVVSQIGTFFAIFLAIISGTFSIIYQFIKNSLNNHKKSFIIISAILILLISRILAYYYDKYNQEKQQEYLNDTWMLESR